MHGHVFLMITLGISSIIGDLNRKIKYLRFVLFGVYDVLIDEHATVMLTKIETKLYATRKERI